MRSRRSKVEARTDGLRLTIVLRKEQMAVVVVRYFISFGLEDWQQPSMRIHKPAKRAVVSSKVVMMTRAPKRTVNWGDACRDRVKWPGPEQWTGLWQHDLVR